MLFQNHLMNDINLRVHDITTLICLTQKAYQDSSFAKVGTCR